MALGGVASNSACQCQRSALSVLFNTGAIGTGLIIGSSTALVRGTATKLTGVMVHRANFLGGPAGLLIGYVILGTYTASPISLLLT